MSSCEGKGRVPYQMVCACANSQRGIRPGVLGKIAKTEKGSINSLSE